MIQNITLKKIIFTFFAFCFLFNANAQTISTAGGTNYAGNYSINNPAPLLVSFVIQNTTATNLSLTTINTQMANYNGVAAGTASINKLYVSTTSLSGVFDVTTAAWSQIGTGASVVPAALTVLPAITGLNFVIPAGAQYRFALELSKGLAFSVIPAPTPTFFSVGGVNLQLGTFQIAGSAVGYAGVTPAVPAGNVGAFFGGSVVLVPAIPCTGTPAPGATISSQNTVCAGINFGLSLTNQTSGTGVTYQWQSSATGTAGSFANIAGATLASYSTTLTASTFYQCLVTCGGNTTASTPKQVLLTPASQCYCTPTTLNCTFDDRIANVTFGALNNTSGTTCTGGYSNYTNVTPALVVPNAIQGVSNPISVTVGPGGTEFVGVWIDYNKNGTFDVAEFTLLGSATPASLTINSNIPVPAAALLGPTRMRVRLQYNTPVLATQACSQTSGFGEVEDYNVNIVQCIPLTVTSQPLAAVTTTCGGSTSIAFAATGTFPVYQWQYRLNATSPWLNVPNTGAYSGTTTNTLVINPTATTLNGYQYRIVYSGGCTSTDFSNVTTLTIAPIVASVTPTSATVCATPGTIVPITINNLASNTTVVFNSTAAVAVPDNNAAATLSNIVVSGIPAGATISKVDVTLNMSHTYPGDMIFNLKAPNTAILNLYKYNSAVATGAASGVPTWGWYGAKISSAGTTAFTTVTTAPYIYNSTTNWKADVYNGPTPPAQMFPFDNPTGYPSTAIGFPALYSVPNGTWTLAMADGGPGDVGTLSSWSIAITYGAPATGIYSALPATPNTIFTNAAATIPYDGVTPINTVYVNPAVNTTYTVNVNASGCSATTTVPVTVNTAIAGTPAVANVTSCVGNNATFAITGVTAGTGITYQWQVSTIAVPTFTNIAGATGATYSITTTSALIGNVYRVILTAGGCTSVNSNGATLTVNPTPIVTISAAPITKLFPGLTTTLTAAVSPNAAATYQWYKNGVVILGATGNRTIVNIDGLGIYTVAVTDVNACAAAVGISTPANIVISDSINLDRLFIYPSPNTGQFQVRFYNDINSSNQTPGVVNVYDEKGSRVFTKTYSVSGAYQAMNVDLGPAHGRGIYRVDLISTSGDRIKTGSVVVF